jgi:hypothetical protein
MPDLARRLDPDRAKRTIATRKHLKIGYAVCRLSGLSTKTPTRSATETSSAKDWTCIFSITPCRWALIVRTVEHNRLATALLVLPRMISSKTCRSRGVNRARRARASSSLSCRLRNVWWCAKAFSIARRRSPHATGLVRKSSAPALMAGEEYDRQR